MTSLEERLRPFAACFNFRDLGGYPTRDGRRTRWGRLFRSDTLHRLTDEDLRAFLSLGLRTVVDLRTRTELDDHGALRADGRSDLEWHHVPLFDGVMRLRPRTPEERAEEEAASPTAAGDSYVRMLGDGAGMARVFELLTAPAGRPAVFHCTSGKDRTGMVAAMVLDLVGVTDEVIAADYELTNGTRSRAGAWIAANEPEFAAFLRQIPAERRHAGSERILEFLHAVRGTHGSVEHYLLDIGLSPTQLDDLRTDLLD